MEKKNNDDKPKIAVALEYTPGEQAPKILATGRGYIAESIIEKAGEADVPVYADSKLADTLSKLEIGEMIPPELYTVVAEILVFVDECDKIKGKVCKYRLLIKELPAQIKNSLLPDILLIMGILFLNGISAIKQVR